MSILLAPTASIQAQLVFQFDKGPGLLALEGGTPPQQQLAADVINGFIAAGDIWSRRLTDNIVVNVDIEFTELGTNVLGSTQSHTMSGTYSNVRGALVGDASTLTDLTATANLPLAGGLDMLTNDTSGASSAPVVRDNDGSTNNTTLDMNRANAKALGMLRRNHGADDGVITFSSQINWDFDPSDGVSSNTFDFRSVAAHEIGHVLGFVSGVDIVDMVAKPDGPSSPLDLDGYRVFSVRDLYRYSADSLAEANQPSTGAVLDLSFGGNPYFSVDAGATSVGRFATGRYNGDGQQASHWKDGQGLGIMDPTSIKGTAVHLSASDLLVMDAIGFDRTPASYGDFNADWAVNAADIEALFDALDASDQDTRWDINYDEQVTPLDMAELIITFLDSTYGDADLDGDVDLDDFTLLKTNFGATAGATWAEGSFDGDGDVDLDDFIVLKGNFGRTAVPEPTAATLIALGALALRRRRT